jgi:hypothetical protein
MQPVRPFIPREKAAAAAAGEKKAIEPVMVTRIEQVSFSSSFRVAAAGKQADRRQLLLQRKAADRQTLGIAQKERERERG